MDVARRTLDVFDLKTGNIALTEIIRAAIRKRGPISFARFMEYALYHPQHGYYSSGRASIGRKGDYFTSVSVGPLFGQLWAAQFAEIWDKLGQPEDFTIVEQGAHDGAFARDVLVAMREKAPECFTAAGYRIIEPFPVWQEWQAKTLQEFGRRVQWRRSLDELEPLTGVHFSNELLDAMPANLKKLVGLDSDQFVFVESLVKAEGKSAVFDWIDTLAGKMERGFVIAVDYGFARSAFREVVQARAQHRHLDSPFEQVGEADITMHINWTDVAERAESNGLRVAGFTDQHHLITGILATSPLPAPNERRALQTLLHPEMLGRAFQVLVLGKAVDLAGPLAGFKFARDPRRALEI